MITIVGVGALGSHVAMLLRNSPRKIRVIDFDKVEQKNTQAQFHTKMGLRKNKAHAINQAMQGMFGKSVDPVPHKLTADNSHVLLADSSLVIDCTDNIEARIVIKSRITPESIPCLHGSLSAGGDFARVMWTEIFEADEEAVDGAVTCEDGEHLPFFGYVSSVIAMEAQRFLKTGKKRNFHLSPGGWVGV